MTLVTVVASIVGGSLLYENIFQDSLPLSVRWKIVAARRFVSESQKNSAIQQYLLAIQDLQPLPQHDRTVVFLQDAVANLAFDQGQYLMASDYFQKTVQGLVRHGYLTSDPAIVELSLKIAYCYERLGRLQDSELGLNWCIEACKAAEAGAKSPEIKTEWTTRLGMVLEQAGSFYVANSNLQKAKECHMGAVEAARALGSGSEDRLAKSLSHLADVLLQQDELRESLAIAREAADVASKSYDRFDYVYFANLASILLTINTRESILEAAGVLAKARERSISKTDLEAIQHIEKLQSRILHAARNH